MIFILLPFSYLLFPSAHASQGLCPSGWITLRDHCVAHVVTPAHTECPGDKSNLLINERSRAVKHFVHPSVCANSFHYAPIETCHADAAMVRVGSELFCRRDIVESPIKNKKGVFCPAGYFLKSGSAKCVAAQESRAYLSCGDNGSIHGKRKSEFVWYDRREISCRHYEYVKGRMWCPNGLEPYGEPYPDVSFGETIPTFNSNNLPRRQVFAGGFQPDRVRSGCFTVVSMIKANCDEFNCVSPALQELGKEIKTFAYKYLLLDQDVTLFNAIPTGDDLPFTFSKRSNPY